MFSYYLYRAVWPMLAVLAGSVSALMIVLWGVSAVEQTKGRLGAFDIELRAIGDAPLWVLMIAGMLLVNGITMARWAVITADVGQRGLGHGYELNVPFPIGKITAVNVLYIGVAVFAFYAVRTLVW